MYGFRAKLDYWLKHNALFEDIFLALGGFALRMIGKFIKIDEHMVIFSGHTRKYNDSSRAIYEYMLSCSEFKNLKYIWALEDPLHVDIPDNPLKVKTDTWAYFKLCLKAKYWISCVNIERGLIFKKKNQIYLNTWHGMPFKRVGNDAGGRHGYNWYYVDYFCYASEYEKNILKRAFGVKEKAFLATGLPRNDELYRITGNEVIELKNKLSIPLYKKVILYAPTWRDSNDRGNTYGIKPPMDVKKWERELNDDYIILMRTHAYTNTLLGVEFNDFIRDYTNYPFVNDLFKVADILISDYSAAMADYSILERPIICFGYDYDSYAAARGLYVDLESMLPNGVQKTEDEVIKLLNTMNYKEQCEMTRNMIKNKYTYLGGKACEICVNNVFKDYRR